jgi:RNA polymerase sigma-70 factor (ECF subfamily)
VVKPAKELGDDDDGYLGELVAQAQSADAVAWGTLVGIVSDDLWRLASHFAEGDRETAADLVQQTYLKAQQSLGQLRDHGRFRNWIRVICRRCWLDQIDERKRHSRDVSMDGLSPYDASADALDRRLNAMAACPNRSPEDGWIARLDLERALDRLQEDERQAFLLIKRIGVTSEEAAEIVGVPASTMRSRLGRARAKLADPLEEYP